MQRATFRFMREELGGDRSIMVCAVNECCQGDQIREGEMGRACGMICAAH